MSCKHRELTLHISPEKGCSSYDTPDKALAAVEKFGAKVRETYGIDDTPDSKKFDVLDAAEVGRYLVMKVQYPNCSACEYEGIKVMVFEDRKVLDVVRWREIDPHFRKADPKAAQTKAPSPIARFPGTSEGWREALSWASWRTLTPKGAAIEVCGSCGKTRAQHATDRPRHVFRPAIADEHDPDLDDAKHTR